MLMKLPAIRETDLLFTPFLYRNLYLRSRIAMAPMCRGLAPDGVPTPEMARYYRARAEHGVGLIVTEPVAVGHSCASYDSCMPNFQGGTTLRAWKRIVESVHAAGSKICVLMTHAGMLRNKEADSFNPDEPSLGPSGRDPYTLEEDGKEMQVSDIEEVCRAFAQAAAIAVVLGFDAVALDGGDGALIEQFLRADTNRRSDIYGGSVEGRVRFAQSVLHAVRHAVGYRYPVLMRLSGVTMGRPMNRMFPDAHTLAVIVQRLVASGVDIFMVTDKHYAEPAFAGNPISLAAWVKMLSRRPVICAGAVGLDGEALEGVARLLILGQTDMVAVGRALLADAVWAEKIRCGKLDEIHPFSQRVLARLF